MNAMDEDRSGSWYNLIMAKEPEKLIAYAPFERSTKARRARRLAWWGMALLLISLMAIPSLYFLGNTLASAKFDGIKPGMTRTQVDRHLWAFIKNRNAQYNSLRPGESATSYEFMGFGKGTQIKVIYKSDGTVAYPVPSFSN